MAVRFCATKCLVSAFLLAPWLIFVPAHQAKAGCDLLACGRLSEDLVTGAATAAWQILKSPECSSDLDENIAVAAALLAIEELPQSPINEANCVGSLKAITDLVGKNAGNPAIKAALSLLTDNSAAQQYLDCACPLAAAGVETISKIIADADACSSFSPSDCIGSLYGVFDKPQLTTGVESCDFTAECGPGTVANCMTKHPFPPSCGNNVGQGYLCAPGLVVAGPPPVVDCGPSGKTQTCTSTNFQSCTCPVGQGWQGDHCGVCPVTKTSSDKLSDDGLSIAHTTCTDQKNPSDDRLSCDGIPTQICTVDKFFCSAGQKVASWGKCAPACGTGQIQDSNGQCKTCPANFKTVFDGPNTSKGTCGECAANETSLEGSYKCTELICAPHGYKDPNKPHACILCPSNQLYSLNSRQGAKGPKAVQAGTCGCGESQVLEGNTCVCAKGASQPPGLTAELACNCPAGSKMNYKTGACVCGPGRHIGLNGAGTANACLLDKGSDAPIPSPVLPPSVKLQPPPKPNKRVNCPPGTYSIPNRPNECIVNQPTHPGGPPIYMPQPGIGGGGGRIFVPGGSGAGPRR